MAERLISVSTYLLILAVLLLFTVLTTAVSFFDLPSTWHMLAGFTIGVVKATLVVLFFMHVLFSPRVVWVVIAVTLFWFFVVLLALTFSDYATRGLIPLMYGH